MLTILALFSFFDGAGDATVAPPVDVPTLGGTNFAGKKRKPRTIKFSEYSQIEERAAEISAWAMPLARVPEVPDAMDDVDTDDEDDAILVALMKVLH